MMIVQGVFRVRAEDRLEYLEHSRETMRVTRAEKGCLEYVLAADPLDDGRIVLSERWESSEDLDAHVLAITERRRNSAAKGEPSGPTALEREIVVYEVVLAKPLG